MNTFLKSILFLLFIVESSQCIAQYKVIPKESIADSIKSKVYSFTYDTSNYCEESSLPKIDSTNANANFIARYDMKLLYDYCADMSRKFGKISEMKLMEVLKDKAGLRIFRYKVKREKSKKDFELTTTISKSGKYAGIGSREPWLDEYAKVKGHGSLQPITLKSLTEIQLDEIKEFAFKTYNKCNAKDFYKLDKNNASLKLLKKNVLQRMLKECDSIKKKLGEFSNLTLVEGLSDMSTIIVFRFKVNFDKLGYNSEIRVYNTIANKFSGIFVIDKWWDKYYDMSNALKRVKDESN